MIYKTKVEILTVLQNIAASYSADLRMSTEDGITWVTMYGGNVNPKIYDEISQKIANETGRSFYFSNCSIDSIEGALNAKLNYYKDEAGKSVQIKDEDIPPIYEESHIEEYGTLFQSS